MILALDIGNTNITVGGIDEEKIHFLARLVTRRDKTKDEYAINLKDLIEIHKYDPHDIEGAIVSSSVPELEDTFSSAIELITGHKPVVVGPGLKSGLNIRIDNPAQLGPDLVVGAVAALNEYKPPLILFDLGTATTVSVIDKNRIFLGGLIFPGVYVALDALSSKTSQLPRIAVEAPKSVIGTNTIDSMKSGAIYGNSAMVDGIIDRIEEEIGGKATIVATGGIAYRIVPHCRRKDIILDDNLLLKGLLLIYRKNIK
ncbi:MAG: type III pantothenate kinase [Oscillospiraceae bacterium]|nr:type III pantothenate kinase [Oscillospiraceae bacterium]